MKEQVLHNAWRKKDVCNVCNDGKMIYRDQDYPPEILKKRKTYVGILRELKAKGIRFQTPYAAKLKVAKDLRMRRFCTENVKEADSTALKQQRMATWEKAGADHHRQVVDYGWIRERLRISACSTRSICCW